MKISKLLRWADKYPYFYFVLQNSPYDDLSHYRWVMGMGRQPHKDLVSEGSWCMGGWSYEMRAPHKKPWIAFPRAAFFVPELVIAMQEAPTWEPEPPANPILTPPQFLQSSLDRTQFIEAVESICDRIYHGEVYQVNLSLALLWQAQLDPIAAYLSLLQSVPTTYNFLFKYQQKYVIGASPERFFWQWHDLIAQQPIKGTIRRGSSWQEDYQLIDSLRKSSKEIAENTMIVDLVRNDLNRVCKAGSVQVSAWAEVQSFPGLHHLVSTIYGEKEKKVSWWDAAMSLFPAGSMTGAPKRAAIYHIKQYEPVGRGIYAGALGYVSADGEADFAVVIRSLVYDKTTRQLVLQVGSGITYDSDPVAEWEETKLKAERILESLRLSAQSLRS
ncbi:MAG: anthranilate synthase component I family protein [Bacteroidia bacterium]|nr:anthranilate synthase component I family protein [Bacteroidia bacterium]MDW8235384.1 anthranilate synthase component I family protein [Bacteroidia bacterium]